MPFKLPLHKLNKMKYNFAPVLQNKLVLYAFLAMTIIRIVFFANSGDMAAIITLGLVGFITSFFSKNMIIILFVALTVSSLLSYGIKANINEGMEDGTDETEEADAEDITKEGVENQDDSENTESSDKNTKKSTDKNTSSNDSTEETNAEAYENKEKLKQGLKKDYPEFQQVQADIMKGIEQMDPLLQKAETFINKYSKLKY